VNGTRSVGRGEAGGRSTTMRGVAFNKKLKDLKPYVFVKVGIGRVLFGNLVRITKRKYPNLGKLLARFLVSADSSTDTIARSFPEVKDARYLFEKELNSGDVLMRHTPSIVGIATQLADNTWWDHVSMIVVQHGDRPSDFPTPPLPPWVPNDFEWDPFHDGQLQLFEANQMGCWVYPLGQYFRVFKRKHRLMLLRQLVLKDAQPHANTKSDRREDLLSTGQKENLEAFVQKIQGTPYEKKIVTELLHLVLVDPPPLNEIANKNAEHLESIFCSELVAESFQVMGLIPESRMNSNEVMPSAFSRDIGVFDRLMELDEAAASAEHFQHIAAKRMGSESLPVYVTTTIDNDLVLGDERLLRWDHIQEYYETKAWWWEKNEE
jgi:hypothetical protein